MGEPENDTPEMTAPEGSPEAETAPETVLTPGPEPAPEPLAQEPYYGTGRRKTSVARVYLRSGGGRLQVNGRSLEEFFQNIQWSHQAREPLRFLDCADQYDADIDVRGGGGGGQAGAVRLGLARALALANPGARLKLRRGGFLTRDPRMKERKKYGQKGARRRFQWTKR